ncbi:hypothetical protein ACFLSZ_06365 [Candidatus Bipolaricaulota bacterium]
MILGVIGALAGANLQIQLSPVVGGLLFFLGWGMCVPLVKSWRLLQGDGEE